MKTSRLWVTGICVLLGWACSDDPDPVPDTGTDAADDTGTDDADDDDDDDDTEGTAEVGATGGEVTVEGGSGVDVPAGALDETVTIEVVAVEAPSPAGATVVGSHYELRPEGQEFTSPVTVTLEIDPSMLPSGSTVEDVVIFTAPAGVSSYTQLDTTVVDASHVSATTPHFSVFVPGIPPGGNCSSNADCNPGMTCVEYRCTAD